MLLLHVLLTLMSGHVVAGNACGGVEGVYICNPFNPTLFDICIGDQKYSMSCPGGLHFNTRTQICDWPKNADCGKPKSHSSGPVSGPHSSRDLDTDGTQESDQQAQGHGDQDYDPHLSESKYDLYQSPNSVTDHEDDVGTEVNSLQKSQKGGQGVRKNPYLYRGTRKEIERREKILKQRQQKGRTGSSRRADDGYNRYDITGRPISQRRADDGYSRHDDKAARERKGKWWNRKSSVKSQDSSADRLADTDTARHVPDKSDNRNQHNRDNNPNSLNYIHQDNLKHPKDQVMSEKSRQRPGKKGFKDRFRLANYLWRASSPKPQEQRPPAHIARASPARSPSRRQKARTGSKGVGLSPSFAPVAAPRAQPPSSQSSPRQAAHHQHQQSAGKAISAAAASASKRGKKKQPKPGKCFPDTCKLPNCRCVGTDIPGDLSVEDTPQMVMLTFDDSVNIGNYDYFMKLFDDGKFRNPNGCPVKSTFFVSGDATQYHYVEKLYNKGHEIASHSISHRSPTTYWAKAGYDGYVNEIVGMRKRLSDKSNIPKDDIKGMRVPFLQVGGDDQYQMLEDFGFTYDTSMVTGNLYRNDNPPIWPFTLDYPPDSKTCSLTPCPTLSYPGLWEVPLIRWYGSNRLACAMPDGCTIGSGKRGTVQFLQNNFLRHYQTNRSPLGIFLHASWFRRKDGNLEGLMDFLGNVTQKKDVWVVSVSQVIDWIRNPVPNSSVGSLSSWSC